MESCWSYNRMKGTNWVKMENNVGKVNKLVVKRKMKES